MVDQRDKSGASTEKIKSFFNEMSTDRNEVIEQNPVIAYEQYLRALNVLNLLDPEPGELILDIGCGNARDLSFLARSRCNVLGIDISIGMLQSASRELTFEGGGLCGYMLQMLNDYLSVTVFLIKFYAAR